MEREKFILWAAVLAALTALAAALWARFQARRTLQKMDAMLDAALRGDFSRTTFDESLRSSVETKLVHYLTACEVSAGNLSLEKEKIKELISDISHQTKTPIANILLYSQLLSEQPLGPEGRQCVQALNAQAEKLRFLIAVLVKTSRLETGILTLCPRQGSTGPMLCQAFEQIGPKARAKGVALCLKNEDQSAFFDPKWTGEAVYNLLDNAVKYTSPGGRVTLSAAAYELFCRIDVEDDGPGIPEQEQAKIFGRFYRSPSVSGEEGTGLGLYLARQIVSGQGGYVKVRSVPGQGSVFSLFLPREG